MITIKQIKAENTYSLRLKVLKTCAEYQYKYYGDFEKSTIHFGAFKSDFLIGVVTLMNTKNNSFKKSQIQLRGMAVDSEYQGLNIGKLLINECDRHCKKTHTNLIWCNAREIVAEFYKKQGFIISGSSFYIKNVGIHFLMYKAI